MSFDTPPYRGPNMFIAAAPGSSTMPRIVTFQEDVEVFRKYREALRPIRDIDLPEGWRLRKGPPYLRLGVYVDCSLEEALAGAKAAAEQLGETLPDNAGCMVIEDIFNRYIMKLLKLENHDRSDLLGSHPVYLPSSTGLPFDFLRWYEFCPNQVDDQGQEHRIYTLFMQPHVRRKVVSAIATAWGVKDSQVEAKWFFAEDRHEPRVHNWISVEQLLSELGMPDEIRNRE
ncbi:hypothetical protein PYCCODRAFT_1455447 [Trametes coccinea BRFM310]|uniref:Uncharacterized protein n=1 Tax=Trametes coccinea (strain BRFM310) TaxID=1353009 RepID=A0A1Y2J4K1_TRAC3|nr:hypothetical protein PYCCODRAFT_1455447 [Trametes coccinea BRFM310]